MKQAYIPEKRVFDLNFFLVSNSGGGKTHLCGTYTMGPVHFYMFDKGGERTLNKLIKERPSSAPPLSVDKLAKEEIKFSDIWKILQQEQKDGFFDHMREQNGLVVFDSITTLNAKAIKELIELNKLKDIGIGKRGTRKGEKEGGMRQQDWGQLLHWMTTLIGCIQDFPCATATNGHLHILMDKNQNIVARYPYVNGQFRQVVGIDFDETYLLEARRGKRTIHFVERLEFQAKSRVFGVDKLEDYDMNMLARAYLDGNLLNQKGKK